MSYAVKEMFLTLQGEGVQAGRRAVFIRFAGCNLWSGREADRASALCTFCDTDFVGLDGDGGGRFADADTLAGRALALWGAAPGAFAVLTGGEPMLQVDQPLVAALQARGFQVAIESNGTLPVLDTIDWVCVSPKGRSEVVQRRGNELKLVWPQPDVDATRMEDWGFEHLLIQPLDGPDRESAVAECIRFVMDRPRWRLSLQTHKMLGLR